MRSSARAAAIAVAGLGLAAGALLYKRHRDTYRCFPTRFGRARIYQVLDDEGSPVRLLEVGGIVQSGTYLDERYTEPVFAYLKGYDLMFRADRPIRRVAVLGCGGYDYPEHLVAAHPEAAVDAVEIDPAITALARRYFFLDRLLEEYRPEEEGRLNLVEADALAFLLAPGPRYDAIVNDAFDGGTPPAHLAGRRFLQAVRSRLAPGGLYLTNIVAPLTGDGAGFLYHQMALMGELFACVYVFPCDGGSLDEPDNIIAVATDRPLPSALAARSL